jgi:IstB-like ATP binding protein
VLPTSSSRSVTALKGLPASLTAVYPNTLARTCSWGWLRLHGTDRRQAGARGRAESSGSAVDREPRDPDCPAFGWISRLPAAEAGYRVRYTLASKLVNELVEAADDKQLTKLINRYGRVDLILVDELGYLALDRRGAELLFQVLTEREERSAIAIASNEPFSSWTKTFADPRLCAAVVDRLTFAGAIIETGSTSYRLAHARNARPAS